MPADVDLVPLGFQPAQRAFARFAQDPQRGGVADEVVDFLALVKAVAEGKQPLYFLESNMTALANAMRESKGEAIIPGVQAVKSVTQGRR